MGYSIQKASLWKRISAWLFDMILVVIFAVLCAWGISAAVGFDAQYDRMNARYAAIAEEYQLDMEAISESAYSELSAEMRAQVEAANAALAADEEAVKAYSLVVQMTIMMVSLSLFVAFMLFEFVIPLLFGHGRTIGKKVFGVAVMRKNGVKISHVSLFIRAILGKYTIETMLPVMVALMFVLGSVNPVALIIAAIVLLFSVFMPLVTQNRVSIHDQLADTIAVDFASQKIFENEAALIAFKEAVHAEKVANEAF